MRNNSFRKSSINLIKNTLTRFISIILISFLGAGVFAGLAAVAPNMTQTGDKYYDDCNVMDIRILSTYGFTDEDVQAIKDVDGVIGAMGCNNIDVTGTVNGNDYTFHINSLPETTNPSDKNYINQLKLVHGRLPEKNNEAVIIVPSTGLRGIEVDNLISLDEKSNSSFSDTINCSEYTIVGVAESPYYLFFIQGNTSIGRGAIDFVLYVPKDNFTIDGYVEVFASISGVKEVNAFGDEYFDEVNTAIKHIELLADNREALRYAKYQNEIEEVKYEYYDAINQLETAKEQLSEGKEPLEGAKKDYSYGLIEYNNQKNEADQKLYEAKAQLDRANFEITSAQRELNSKREEFNLAESRLRSERVKLNNLWNDFNSKSNELNEEKNRLAQSKEILDQLQSQYDVQAASIESAIGMIIGQIEANLPQISNEQYDQLNLLEATNNELNQRWQEYYAASAQIEQSESQLIAAKAELDNAEREYALKSSELEYANSQLNSAENTLNDSKNKYETSLLEYNTQKSEIDLKLADAKRQLDDAAEQIEAGEKELNEKQQEYEEKEMEANEKLPEAQQDIKEAEQKLASLGKPQWYVMDRNMNESFVSYKNDTERMRNLSTIFPIIFFLVAILVCLTTMTRMVDEDRTLIGTFKALGYSNRKIAGRYLEYAASASLIGSVIGVFLGFWIIPIIIWNAHEIVFRLPKLIPNFYFDIAFISIFTTVTIVTLSTGFAVKKSLQEVPSDLMRPKAPKNGKRVFLEYIKPIWNRMTFTQKVTIRNLGLNKKRFIMTLVGILGCTSLVVTGLGARNAVQTIVDKQFDEIFHYNATVSFNYNKPSDELISLLSNKEYFSGFTEVFLKSAEVSLEDNDDAFNTYIVSPEHEEDFIKYVSMREPGTKKELKFNETSVIITEKLAMNLNIGVGDTLKLKYFDKNDSHLVTVTDISTNYAFNYIYFGKDIYKETFGGLPEYNQFFTIIADEHNNEDIKTYLSSASGIGVVSFTNEIMGNVTTSIDSINTIIWVLIIAAGLLAFVVLYNLTNINIGERQREIATLKVLGFYDKETYSYIFRETIILSIIGCLLGLIGGIFLYQAVITTVEPTMILLTRELTWEGFLGAATLTMLFTIIVNMSLKIKIKNIDMLESLKSVD